MHKKPAILILFALLPLLCFSQRGKKQKGSTVYVATTLNYYPAIEPYSFFSSFMDEDRNLILEFLTANSGKFVIEEAEAVLINRENSTAFPSQLLGVGASLQVLKYSGLFHEVSLTKLSFNKSAHHIDFIVVDTAEARVPYTLGYDERGSAFGFRYELGKYFGDRRNSVRFGISGGFETSFYSYKKTPRDISSYPLRARIMTIEVAAIPMLTAKLSKQISMDFKVIPNMLLGDFASVEEQNPLVPLDQQAGEREYNLPEVNVAFSLLLRYVIKESKK